MIGEYTDLWKICQPSEFSDSRICKLECDYAEDTVCTVYYDECKSKLFSTFTFGILLISK